jgi:hypothetical protein
MTRTLLAILALLVLVASGVVHGLWTDRWRTTGEPAAWAARLADVPRTFGDWEGQDLTLDDNSLEVAEVTGYLARDYVHRRTGARVQVVIVCGRPGPISVHTPDVCLRGNGHGMVAAPAKYPVGGAEFWTAKFRKDDAAVPVHLRMFWSWNAGGGWKASASPRLDFARHPALYKLYVARPLAALEEPLDRDPCLDLLPRLLPGLQRALFPGATPGAEQSLLPWCERCTL